MKIYVLSLSSAQQRQDSIESQFVGRGFDYEFFWGVDGRAGWHPLFDHYDERLRMKIKGEPFLPGQLGCYAGHYLLWNKCLELGKPCIILEDDALINPSKLSEFIDLAADLDAKYECVRLFENKSRVRKAVPVGRLGSFEICKYLKGHMRATGYYLTPSGAKKFLESSSPWVLPVDIFMDQFWNNGVECYGIEPPCITNDESLDSQMNYISKTKKPRKTISVKVYREVYLLKNNLLRLFWNVAFVVRSKRLFKRKYI